MRFRERFLLVYPVLGLLGCALVIGVADEARPDLAIWWLVALAAVGVGTSIGWIASHEDPDASEPAKSPNYGLAALSAAVAVPGGIYLRQSVKPEAIIFLFGILTLSLASGFALGALHRFVSLRDSKR